MLGYTQEKLKTIALAGTLLLCLGCSSPIPKSNIAPPQELIQTPNKIRQYPNNPSFGATVQYTIKLQNDYKELEAKDTALVDWIKDHFKVAN